MKNAIARSFTMWKLPKSLRAARSRFGNAAIAVILLWELQHPKYAPFVHIRKPFLRSSPKTTDAKHGNFPQSAVPALFSHRFCQPHALSKKDRPWKIPVDLFLRLHAAVAAKRMRGVARFARCAVMTTMGQYENSSCGSNPPHRKIPIPDNDSRHCRHTRRFANNRQAPPPLPSRS